MAEVVDIDAPPVLVVDHHACGTSFGDQRLIDVAAAATAELVASLIDGLGVSITPEMAACLYVGLASDTGSFRYAATSSASHRLAARLLAAGAPHAQISSQLWDTRPASYLAVLTAALGRVERAGEVIWTYVTARDLEASGATIEEAEGIVDVLRVAREHEVAVVLKEDDHRCRKSLEGLRTLAWAGRRRRGLHRARGWRTPVGCGLRGRRRACRGHRRLQAVLAAGG